MLMNVLSYHNPSMPPGDTAWSFIPSCSFPGLHTPPGWHKHSGSNALGTICLENVANIKDPSKSPWNTCVDENLCPVHEKEENMASLLLAMLYTHPPSLNKFHPRKADAGATVPFGDTGQPKTLINFIASLLPFHQAISPVRTGHEASLE